ncbi:NXPE family member 3-like [Glandiceps talaboti]
MGHPAVMSNREIIVRTLMLLTGITIGLVISNMEVDNITFNNAISIFKPSTSLPKRVRFIPSESHFISEVKQLMEEMRLKEKNVNDSNFKRRGQKNMLPFTSKVGSVLPISPLKSKFRLTPSFNQYGQQHTEGEYVHVVLDAFDVNGLQRIVGGDFFFAIMSNLNKGKTTAGRVVDYKNGSYSVYFYAGWSGLANITISLIHPSEAIDFIKTSYLPKERRVDWIGYFKGGIQKEKSVCYIARESILKDKCIYQNQNALGGTVFVCDKPRTLSCDQLASYNVNKTSLGNHVKILLPQDQRYLFARPYLRTLLADSPLKIVIQDADKDHHEKIKLPVCGAQLPIPISDGYWESDIWTSKTCRTRHWTADEAKQCLQGKNVYMLGDSTLRQWHESVTQLLGQKVQRSIIQRSWTDSNVNMSVVFQFHAIIIASATFQFWDQVFESDFINNIKLGNCNHIIVLSLTYHFPAWPIKSYIERVIHVRQAIIRLQKQCPDVVVVIKSSHPRDHNSLESHIHSSDWTLFMMNKILRQVFDNLGISFIDIYDMALSHFAVNKVHMPMQTVIRQQIDMFLSYVCPNTV